MIHVLIANTHFTETDLYSLRDSSIYINIDVSAKSLLVFGNANFWFQFLNRAITTFGMEIQAVTISEGGRVYSLTQIFRFFSLHYACKSYTQVPVDTVWDILLCWRHNVFPQLAALIKQLWICTVCDCFTMWRVLASLIGSAEQCCVWLHQLLEMMSLVVTTTTLNHVKKNGQILICLQLYTQERCIHG